MVAVKNHLNSICIVRISSLGDILLASPLLRLLRHRYPMARIDVVTSKFFADMLRYNPHLTSIIGIDTILGVQGIISARSKTKDSFYQLDSNLSNKYDVIIDLQRNLRSILFRFGQAKKIKKIKKHRLQKILLVRCKRGIGGKTLPIPLRYMDAAAQLGITDDGRGLEFWLPEERFIGEYLPEKRKLRSLASIVLERRPIIAFAPGARHFTKRWLPERFAELGNLLYAKYKAQIILIGGEDDIALCQKIAGMVTFSIENKAGISLFDSVRALDRCDAVVTNDSAAMHIAASRHVPAVAIFGSTVRELGFEPFRSPYFIAEAELPCRPCSHIGLDRCPEGHFNCMKKVNSSVVLNLLGSFPDV